MKPEQDQLLCTQFPLLYRDRHGSMAQTCMCWGFECGPGWFQIIYDLSTKLEAIIQKLPKDGCECGHKEHASVCNEPYQWREIKGTCKCEAFVPNLPKAVQVKEKYNSLRFYLNYGTEEMYNLIDEAEHLSSVTCEECGSKGEGREIYGWYSTLCDEHYNSELERHKML